MHLCKDGKHSTFPSGAAHAEYVARIAERWCAGGRGLPRVFALDRQQDSVAARTVLLGDAVFGFRLGVGW
jgi:hypothetical protein